MSSSSAGLQHEVSIPLEPHTAPKLENMMAQAVGITQQASLELQKRRTDTAVLVSRDLDISHENAFAILNGTFTANRFAYLRVKVPEREEHIVVVDEDSGRVSIRPKPASPAQYNDDIHAFLECAINFSVIYARIFGPEHHETATAIMQWVSFIAFHGNHYTPRACIAYALKTLDRSLNMRAMHDPQSWASQSASYQSIFFNPTTMKELNSHRPRGGGSGGRKRARRGRKARGRG